MATDNIYDAKAAETQANPGTNVNAFIIRAAMDNCIRHVVYEFAGNLPSLLEFKNSANATHFDFSRLSAARLHSTPRG
jgi:hypothetical protein